VKSFTPHFPGDTPAEDISDELVALGFSVISVRRLTTTKQHPQGGNQVETLPLFLVNLARNEKSPEIFKLTNLSHVIIKFEAYRAQESLTQCYNCQHFGYIWATLRPLVEYGAVAVTLIKIALRRETPNTKLLQL
jgi:hypothetical protein